MTVTNTLQHAVAALRQKGPSPNAANDLLLAIPKVDRVTSALRKLLEVSDMAPEPNCCCHLSPPCNDCVEWSGLRMARADARAILKEIESQ
jgi:hypothetical protein